MTKKRDRPPKPEQGTLLEEEGLRVESDRLVAPGVELPMDDVVAVEAQVSKPLLVPVLLALLGTLNLAFAMQTGHADMFVASGLMLGAGLWFWFRGKRHVLSVTTPAGEQRIWYTRDEQACRRVLDLLRERIETLRLKA